MGGGVREAREGSPLLTVETEANRDLVSTYEGGPFFVGSLGSSCQYKRVCPALAVLVGPVQNIISLPCTISVHLPISPTKLGRQSCRVACLLICVSG